MKNKNIYLNRLLKLAQNISDPHIHDRLFKREAAYNASSEGTNVEYFFWALESMPRIFPKYWENIERIPRLTAYPKLSPLTAAAEFFGLTMDTVAHLFVPGMQNKFLGAKLGKNATPDELISNIYEFVYCVDFDKVHEYSIYEEIEEGEQLKKLLFNQSKNQKNAA